MADLIDHAMLQRREPGAAASSLNIADRTVEVIWTTGAGVRRRGNDGPFLEELSLEPSHVRLERLNAGASVLDSHDAYSMGARVGTVVPGSVRILGGKGLATIRLSTGQLGETLLNDLAAGHRLQISAGYRIHQSERHEGADDQLPIIRAVDWEPLELSVVPIPADPGALSRSEVAPMPEAAGIPRQPDDVTTRTVAAERQRVAEIGAIGTRARMPRAAIDQAIADGIAVDQFRARAFDAIADEADRSQIVTWATPRRHYDDDRQSRREAMTDALVARILPKTELSDQAREYAGLTVPEIARRCIEAVGERTVGMAPSSLITRAFHTTSDFPLLMGDVGARALRAAYEAAPAPIKQVARQTKAKDFKAKHSLQLSEGPALLKVNEHGEFKSGTFSESESSYRINTFGRIFGITRQALINDDLSAFEQVPAKLGRAAEAFEAQFLVDLIQSNPVMSDGKALFHADHGNLASPAATLSVASLTTARKALRKQTGLAGELITVTPKFLIVSPELETLAEQILAEIAATTIEAVNPFAKSLTLIVEPRLTGNNGLSWYLAAAPSEVDGLEYAYLAGEEGPQFETRWGFEVDGVETKVRLDFGGGFVDHRSWYKNPGAA